MERVAGHVHYPREYERDGPGEVRPGHSVRACDRLLRASGPGRLRAANDDRQRQLPTTLTLLRDGPAGITAGASP